MDKMGFEFDKNDLMNSEWMRLASFASFPRDTTVHTTRLAQAGFYYKGHQDEVTCFSCNVKYKGWKKDDFPAKIHKEISPQCPFITGNEIPNCPLKKSNTPFINERSNASESASNILNHPAIPVDETNTSNVSATVIRSPSDAKNELTSARLEITSFDETTALELTSNQAPTKERTISFSQTTTANNHTRLGRVSPGMTTAASASTSARATEQEAANFQLDPLDVCYQRPVHPQYALTIVRLSSFQMWPKEKKQVPEVMAKAGLFYEGIDDRARCFFCGGGLFKWDPEDDPWIEHARWFPRCVYLRQSKGDCFVYRVQAEMNEGQKEKLHLQRTKNGNSDRAEQTATPDTDKMMSHPAVLSVLDIGVDLSMVKTALHRLQTENGIEGLKAEKLLEVVFEIEDKNIGKCQSDKLENQNCISERSDDYESANGENCAEKNDENGANNENELHKTEENRAMDEAERRAVMEENRYLRELQLCKICLDEDLSIVFLPCGHMASCASCAPALRKCPICRTFVKGTVKAILS